MSDQGNRELLRRHIKDLAGLSEKRRKPCFTAFLSETEVPDATATAKSCGAEIAFWGGFDGSERTIGGVCFDGVDPPEPEDFPLITFTVSFRASARLSHRDFLGTLMSLGINRDTVGDIQVGDGVGVIVIAKSVAQLVKNELTQVGGEGVVLGEGITKAVPPKEFDEISGTVSSLRLDCLVALATKLSRTKAVELIDSGRCVFDGRECVKPDKEIFEATFSIKGFGKYRLEQIGGLSKKGKTYITIHKYK